MYKISELNSISTLLSRCLRLAHTITGDNSRLATAGWLDLTRTGFPPTRLITLCWAHNYYLSAHYINNLYFTVNYYCDLTNSNYIIFMHQPMVVLVVNIKCFYFLTPYYSIFKEHYSYLHFQKLRRLYFRLRHKNAPKFNP